MMKNRWNHELSNGILSHVVDHSGQCLTLLWIEINTEKTLLHFPDVSQCSKNMVEWSRNIFGKIKFSRFFRFFGFFRFFRFFADLDQIVIDLIPIVANFYYFLL